MFARPLIGQLARQPKRDQQASIASRSDFKENAPFHLVMPDRPFAESEAGLSEVNQSFQVETHSNLALPFK